MGFFEGKAYALQSNDFEYEVYGERITITGYNGTETDVIIPEQIEGKTVTSMLPVFKVILLKIMIISLLLEYQVVLNHCQETFFIIVII